MQDRKILCQETVLIISFSFNTLVFKQNFIFVSVVEKYIFMEILCISIILGISISMTKEVNFALYKYFIIIIVINT